MDVKRILLLTVRTRTLAEAKSNPRLYQSRISHGRSLDRMERMWWWRRILNQIEIEISRLVEWLKPHETKKKKIEIPFANSKNHPFDAKRSSATCMHPARNLSLSASQMAVRTLRTTSAKPWVYNKFKKTSLHEDTKTNPLKRYSYFDGVNIDVSTRWGLVFSLGFRWVLQPMVFAFGIWNLDQESIQVVSLP